MSSSVPAQTRSVLLSPNAWIGEHHNTHNPRPSITDHDQSFGQTNQTWVLGEDASLPTVVENLRDICAFASTILGHVASADSELPSSTSPPTPTPTSNGGSYPEYPVQTAFIAIVILLSVLGL